MCPTPRHLRKSKDSPPTGAAISLPSANTSKTSSDSELQCQDGIASKRAPKHTTDGVAMEHEDVAWASFGKLPDIDLLGKKRLAQVYQEIPKSASSVCAYIRWQHRRFTVARKHVRKTDLRLDRSQCRRVKYDDKGKIRV
jgi:hypothetical protein